ncbi:class 1 fructose-bisphosphatase [Amycolatopsis sp. SID8362]|uniref:class 1 fructose-bisphosphatase n=1 Tax=Amycolatopsis sp. SID8362 TaxID=2690346 RepID=UPI001943AED0|nr:class 1 fructose-bisphosphatase [Amycolatopsis sp. SID8362]
MLTERSTLTQFLIEERRRHPGSSGELNGLILDVALACKTISGQINVQGEAQQKLDVVANDIFLRANEWGGHLAGMASEELEEPYPMDGSSNIDVNVAVGSIFSILWVPTAGAPVTTEDFLRPGTEQVAAGYALYGPATVLVLSVGTGVHSFTLDPILGEFFLTRQDIKLPGTTAEYAVNSSNRRFWEPAVLRYVDECRQGVNGPREKDFKGIVASLVAETHRILTRGGVFLYPRDTKDPAKPGRLRLLYEANPVAFLIEQAGSRSSCAEHSTVSIERPGWRSCLTRGPAEWLTVLEQRGAARHTEDGVPRTFRISREVPRGRTAGWPEREGPP